MNYKQKKKLLSFCKEHAENPTPQDIFDNGLKPLLELVDNNKSVCFSFEFITKGSDELKQRIIYEDKGKKQISSWITYENNETNRNQIEAIKRTYLSLKEQNETNNESEIYHLDQDFLSSSKYIIFLCETSEIYIYELSIAETDSLLKDLMEKKEKTKKIFLEDINKVIDIQSSYLTKKKSNNNKTLHIDKYMVDSLLESSPLEFVTGNDLLSRPIDEVHLINKAVKNLLDIQKEIKDRKIAKKIESHLKTFFDIQAKSAIFYNLKTEINILIKKGILQKLDIITKRNNTHIENRTHNDIEMTFSDCVGTIMNNLICEIDKLNGLQTDDHKITHIDIRLDNVTLEKHIALYTQMTDIVKLIMDANDLILKSQETHNVKISKEHVMKFFTKLNAIIGDTQELLPLLKLHSRKAS